MKVIQIQLLRVLLIQLAVCSINGFLFSFILARPLLPNSFSILTRVNKGCGSSCPDEEKQIYWSPGGLVDWFETGSASEEAILGTVSPAAATFDSRKYLKWIMTNCCCCSRQLYFTFVPINQHLRSVFLRSSCLLLLTEEQLSAAAVIMGWREKKKKAYYCSTWPRCWGLHVNKLASSLLIGQSTACCFSLCVAFIFLLLMPNCPFFFFAS